MVNKSVFIQHLWDGLDWWRIYHIAIRCLPARTSGKDHSLEPIWEKSQGLVQLRTWSALSQRRRSPFVHLQRKAWSLQLIWSIQIRSSWQAQSKIYQARQAAGNPSRKSPCFGRKSRRSWSNTLIIRYVTTASLTPFYLICYRHYAKSTLSASLNLSKTQYQ